MVSYMTNDPSACVHLGPCVQWTLSTSDGVPFYSLCQDEQQNLMTSCYSLLDGEDIEDVTCADGSGYTVADNEDEDSYEFFSLNTDLHLGWTIGVHFFQTHFDLNLPVRGGIHPTTGQYSCFMITGFPFWLQTRIQFSIPPRFVLSETFCQ